MIGDGAMALHMCDQRRLATAEADRRRVAIGANGADRAGAPARALARGAVAGQSWSWPQPRAPCAAVPRPAGNAGTMS